MRISGFGFRAVLGGVSGALFFSACSTTPKARLMEWKNDELTVCCLRTSCSDKDWQDIAARQCNGAVKLVGGKISQSVSGYSGSGEKDKVVLQPQLREQTCRTFQCQGTVIPPQ